MLKDPRVYIVLCLTEEQEVEYSVCHLFNGENEIVTSRNGFSPSDTNPYDELRECLIWGEGVVERFYSGELFVPSS